LYSPRFARNRPQDDLPMLCRACLHVNVRHISAERGRWPIISSKSSRGREKRERCWFGEAVDPCR
jgi:hypothetical protein